MPIPARAGTSDRIFAVLLLVVLAGAAWVGWRIEETFSYEPIGPRAYPLLLCALMAACAVWLLIKPDPAAQLPRGPLRILVGLLLAALLAWSLLFAVLGFIASTALASAAIARLFGAAWVKCVAFGVVSSVALYLFFDKLLEVTLPVGRLFAG
jgi:putative tricarboxylic transport membrane protein